MCAASKPDIHSLLELLQSFSQAVLRDAVPELDGVRSERAYTSAIQAMCNHPCFTFFLNEQTQAVPDPPAGNRRLQLLLSHKCKYIGCHKATCDLCRNNQEKRCAVGDNMDEYYIVRKSIKSKCGADVMVELVDADTKQPVRDLNLQLQVSVTDGDRIEHPGQLDDLADIEIFAHKDNNNQPLLLTANPVRRDSYGRLLISLQDGIAYLPDISVSCVTEKLEVRSFRLLVTNASSQDTTPQPAIEPALSCRFKVITQRAWNDRKATYPHIDDRVNRLDFIGKEAVQKLQKLEQELAKAGFSLPAMTSIQTVGQLKQLKEHMQQDHTLQSTIIRMLNLNHERWTNICHVLDERTVVSDNLPRAFFPPQQGAAKQLEGLFYKSRQAKVDLKNPDGLIQKVPTKDGRDTYVVTLFSSGSTALLHKKVDAWRSMAISCWSQDSHPGWCMAPEHKLEGCHSPSKSSGSWGGAATSSAPYLGLEALKPHQRSKLDGSLDSPSCRSTPSSHYALPSPSSGLPRDISNLPHYYNVRPKRAHSECVAAAPPAGTLGDRAHSAPEALLSHDHASLSAAPTTTSPKSSQTREVSLSAAGSCNTNNSTTSPPNSSRYADARNSGLPHTPRKVTRALFSPCKGSQTSNRGQNPNLATTLDPLNPTSRTSPDTILRNTFAPNPMAVHLNHASHSPINPNIDPNSSHAMALCAEAAANADLTSALNNSLLPPFPPNMDCTQLPELNLEPLMTSHLPASQGLPTGLYTPSQGSPAGLPPSPLSTFTCLRNDPSPPTSSRSSPPGSIYDAPHSNIYNHPPYPQDPTSSSSTCFTSLLQAASDGLPDPIPASNSGNLNSPSSFQNSPSSFHMPTAFGAPQLEGVLTNIASYVPQRAASQKLPKSTDPPLLQQLMPQPNPNWPQQPECTLMQSDAQGYYTLGATPRSHSPGQHMPNPNPNPNLHPNLGQGHMAVSTPMMMNTNTSLFETPSFDLISNVSDISLDSMPSIGMMVSACMANPPASQPNLSPTSSGMAWEAVILEAAQNLSRLPNNNGHMSHVSNLHQPQQQATQW